jgi:hypothetical protein
MGRDPIASPRRPSRRAVAAAAAAGALLHTLTVLWAWETWGAFGRANVLVWMDFPVSLFYLSLEGGRMLAWSLIAGGLQWALWAALLAWIVGRSARRRGSR